MTELHSQTVVPHRYLPLDHTNDYLAVVVLLFILLAKRRSEEKRTMISAAALQRTAFALPVPLFGSVESAVRFGLVKVKKAPKFLPWGVPAAAGGLWFIWPAVQMEMEKGSD